MIFENILVYYTYPAGFQDMNTIRITVLQSNCFAFAEVMESVDAPIAEELQEDNPPQTSEPEGLILFNLLIL